MQAEHDTHGVDHDGAEPTFANDRPVSLHRRLLLFAVAAYDVPTLTREVNSARVRAQATAAAARA